MKLTLIFLICFVSTTWQQNAFWSYPHQRHFPYYSNFGSGFQNNYPIFGSNQGQQAGMAARWNHGQQDYTSYESVPAQRPTLERSLGNNFFQKKKDARLFGLGYAGLNYLASIILDSLQLTASFTSTSTTFITSTSIFTSWTQSTCFTRTMFTSTAACRRKRNFSPKLLIGDDDTESDYAAVLAMASFEDGGKAIINLNALPRAGSDIDLSRVLVSSKKEEEEIPQSSFLGKSKAPANPLLIPQKRQTTNVSVVVVTSTLTSFSLRYSSWQRIVTNIANETALSCLPNGFTLC